MAEEGLKKTPNRLIHIGCPIPFETDEFLEQLEDLMLAAYNNKENVRDLVRRMVTTYHPENQGKKPEKKPEPMPVESKNEQILSEQAG